MVTREEHSRLVRDCEGADASFKEAHQNMMMTADGPLGLRMARAKLGAAMRKREYAKQALRRHEMDQVCAAAMSVSV
jgi:hypothetical protein